MTEPQPPADPTPLAPKPDDELKAFLLVFRQGMLLVTRFIEKKYDLPCKCETCEALRRKQAA